MKKPEHFIKKWTTVLKVTKPSAQSFLKTEHPKPRGQPF